MARQAQKNRAKSLKRSKLGAAVGAKKTGLSSFLKGIKDRVSATIGKALEISRKVLGRESAAQKRAREKQQRDAEKEIKRAQRHADIRSRITVLRGPKQVESSWVAEIAYVRYGRNNGVAVKFLSGFEAFYTGTTLKDYEYLRDAASKGKAIHRRFYDLSYEQMN